MISTEYDFLTMINSPVRQFKGRVGLYEGSTLLSTFNYDDALQSFTIDKSVEQGKFFGFGVCQKLTLKLVDRNRTINIVKGNNLIVEFGVEDEYINPYPTFCVTEVLRDENTNGLTVTAYDALYKASAHTVSELNSTNSYTIREFIGYCAYFLGLTVATVGIDDACLNTYYETGANFEGIETIREALNAVAEATQSIYYVSNDGVLVFKRLDMTGDALLTIDKAKYFTLSNKTSHTVTGICHATELGDNFTAGDDSGEMVYIRNNPFWELRDDANTLVENALTAVNGLTIVQYDCKWRGNFLMEIGDKISIITKDGGTITSYLLSDSVTYNGAISEQSSLTYTENNQNETTPATIGEALRQTFAKVDRVEGTVEIVSGEVAQYESRIASLELDTESISAVVEQIDTNTANRIDATDQSVASLTERLDATLTKDAMEVRVQEIVDNGATHVVTETGFTFNDEGLTISKSDSEMETTITENGMTVYKNDEAVLTANNSGVNAVNLHASTYLIVGTNSRFEDYGAGSHRTGCFWIG